MTKDETIEVLSLIKNMYRSQFIKIGKKDGQIMVDYWQKMFSNVPKDVVLSAVESLFNSSKFVPTIADVVDQILYECNLVYPPFDEVIAFLSKKVDLKKNIEHGMYTVQYSELYDECPNFIKKIFTDIYEFERVCKRIEHNELQFDNGLEKRYARFICNDKSEIFASKNFEDILELKRNEYSLFKSNEALIQNEQIVDDDNHLYEDEYPIDMDTARRILSASSACNDDHANLDIKVKDIYEFLKAKPCDYDVFEDLIMYGCAEYICHCDKPFDDLTNGDIAELEALRNNTSLMSKVAIWIQEDR